MKKLRLYLQQHPKALKALVLGYVVFAGCFVFPFGNERFPLDFTKAYLLLATYSIIALGFASIWGMHRHIAVYFTSLILTTIGMICRYILEYGEVSNTMNFTLPSILSYLILIPILVTAAYHLITHYLARAK